MSDDPSTQAATSTEVYAPEPYVRDCVLAQLEWETRRGRPGGLSEVEASRLSIRASSLVAKVKADALRSAAKDGKIDCASSLYLNYLADRIEGQ